MGIKYKCIIADDNLLDRDIVELYLKKIETLSIEAICTNGLEAAAALNNKDIDIVFSDIDMPDLNGMELLKSLREPPVFIFISSYGEHAADSYNLDVIDFIVKPVNLPRLLKATAKAIEYIELKKALSVNETNINNLPRRENPDAQDYFYIKENYEYIRIEKEDVVYIESMGNFSRLHTVQNKKHITLVSLKNIESQLPLKDFIRVHKQFIINLNHIISIATNGDITLKENAIIPIGTAYKNAVMDIINSNTLLR